MFSIKQPAICDYGCGRNAKYSFKNGKRCCEKSTNSCPSKKIKSIREDWKHTKETIEKIKIKRKQQIIRKGWKHTEETKQKMRRKAKDRVVSNETKKKMSNTHLKRFENINERKKLSLVRKGVPVIGNRLTIEKIKERYPLFYKIEEIKYNPNKPGEREIQVHCKNHNCKNSKERGGWFTPTKIQFRERVRALEDLHGSDGSYYYCSDRCKEECPLYNLRHDPFSNNCEFFSDNEYRIFRDEVLQRQKDILGHNECEYCENQNINELAVHHEKPRKLYPHLALDPDNGIVLCGSNSQNKCHYKIGHKNDCSTSNLAKGE